MPIIINLDVMLARRKMKLQDLAETVGKAKAVRFSTLEAICHALNCQPGDILEFKE